MQTACFATWKSVITFLIKNVTTLKMNYVSYLIIEYRLFGAFVSACVPECVTDSFIFSKAYLYPVPDLHAERT